MFAFLIYLTWRLEKYIPFEGTYVPRTYNKDSGCGEAHEMLCHVLLLLVCCSGGLILHVLVALILFPKVDIHYTHRPIAWNLELTAPRMSRRRNTNIMTIGGYVSFHSRYTYSDYIEGS